MRTYATILTLLVMSGPSWAAEPTLARLSFWLPPERMDEFATAYQEKLLPILKEHGLVESAQLSRATVDSVFSRLFEFDSPPRFRHCRQHSRQIKDWLPCLANMASYLVFVQLRQPRSDSATIRQGRDRGRLFVPVAGRRYPRVVVKGTGLTMMSRMAWEV